MTGMFPNEQWASLRSQRRVGAGGVVCTGCGRILPHEDRAQHAEECGEAISRRTVEEIERWLRQAA